MKDLLYLKDKLKISYNYCTMHIGKHIPILKIYYQKIFGPAHLRALNL